MNTPIPQGKYTPAIRVNNIIYTSGMTPRKDGVLISEGPILLSDPLDKYKESVELAATNVLNAAKSILNENERIVKIINMTVFIAAEANFKNHSKIADYASEYLFQEFGENGISTRAAIGVYSLPGNAPIEIQIVALTNSN